jgi:hypothetical protein
MNNVTIKYVTWKFSELARGDKFKVGGNSDLFLKVGVAGVDAINLTRGCEDKFAPQAEVIMADYPETLKPFNELGDGEFFLHHGVLYFTCRVTEGTPGDYDDPEEEYQVYRRMDGGVDAIIGDNEMIRPVGARIEVGY